MFTYKALLYFPGFVLCSMFFVSVPSCQRKPASSAKNKPLFNNIPTVVNVIPLIAEASGIADSRKIAGSLWVQEDSGNPPLLTLLSYSGTVQKTVYIKGAVNRDWEDMARAGSNIYIGDIGDNNAIYNDYTFYKFPEPDLSIDTVSGFETIRFRYPDGAHDAEAFLVEPLTGDIYIITKRDVPSRIYRLSAPFTSSVIYMATAAGQLGYSGVVSAALSPDAKEIVVKTYLSLSYYKLEGAEKIETALQKNPVALPYLAEPQGEAITFRNDNSGYFTLSEKGFGADAKLYFYKRN